jgi:hypothetical protein
MAPPKIDPIHFMEDARNDKEVTARSMGIRGNRQHSAQRTMLIIP